MRKTKILLSIIFVSLTVCLYSQSAKEISEKSIDAVFSDSFEMSASLKIYDAKGNERVRKLSTASRKFGDTNKTLMKFTSPADVEGTSLLIHDHEMKGADMWIYLPAIRRVRRIAGRDKSNNFMGSEFSNADMSRPNINDFNHKILGVVTYNGKKCWKIESKCKTPEVEDEQGYSKKIYYIEQASYFAHKAEYYDFNDELHKIQIIKDYRKQSDGSYFAFHLEMENKQNGRKSVMIIDRFQLESNLQENIFSPAMLEN